MKLSGPIAENLGKKLTLFAKTGTELREKYETYVDSANDVIRPPSPPPSQPAT